MSNDEQAPKTVRIDLTDAQKERIAQALGQAKLATEEMAIELTIDEMEQRITPRVALN